MACGDITANFTFSCTDPLVAGLESTLTLINFEDWLDATIVNDGTDDLAIKSITLATGKTAFSFAGYRNTLRAMEDSSVENGLTRYKHIVNFQLADDDATTKRLERTLGLGTYVAVVFTKARTIEIYGAGTGLVIQGQTQRDRYASNAVATLQLASDDESLEVNPPANFIGTATTYDFAAAKAEVEALWL